MWQPIETAPKELPAFEEIILARFIFLESGRVHKSWQTTGYWRSGIKKWVMCADCLDGVSGGSCVTL